MSARGRTIVTPKTRQNLDGKVIQIHISLVGSEPLIWRRLQVPANITLRSLHRVIQAAMPWKSLHVWLYEIGKDLYGDPEFDHEYMWDNDQTKKLAQVYRKTDRFYYVYDLGDDWRHEIRIEEVLDPDPKQKYPLCVAGEHACPPEDCGGMSGYEELKQALAEPDNPEYAELLEWAETHFYFKEFDIGLVNEFFLPRRRHL